jgi:ubiquinone/menaquinone biosynthesis C-methylase UbiE
MSQQVSYRHYSGNAAENYERYFVPTIATPVARALLEAADLQPGERVLDVACGTGVIARLAAERVGSSGSVTGVDVAPDMIDVARSIPVPSGLTIEWHQADAASLPLPDASFDVVFCQMGLMFMNDKATALSEMRRVLAPGGRLAVNTPGAIQRPLEIMAEALARHISPDLAGFVHLVFSMDDPGVLDGLLRDAGFRDVEATAGTVTLRLPPPADFLWQYINMTPMGAFVAQAPEEAQDALERDVVDQWRQLVGDSPSVVFDQPMVIATAQT